MRLTKRLVNVKQGYMEMRLLWPEIEHALHNGVELEVRVQKARRTLPQNRLMWKILDAIAAQLVWHGEKLDSDEWKEFIGAVLRKQKVVRGPDGGLIVLPTRTSELDVEDESEFIEYAYAFAAMNGVEIPEMTSAV